MTMTLRNFFTPLGVWAAFLRFYLTAYVTPWRGHRMLTICRSRHVMLQFGSSLVQFPVPLLQDWVLVADNTRVLWCCPGLVPLLLKRPDDLGELIRIVNDYVARLERGQN